MKALGATMILVGLLLCLLLFAGCGDSQPKQKKQIATSKAPAQTAPPAKAAPKSRVEVKLTDIALDDPSGKASLTRNFYFIFDGSGSMREDLDNKVKLEGAQGAVRAFLTKIPDDDNIGLYVFDSQGAREAVPLGSGNRPVFMEAINNVQAAGGTPLAEAIRFGTKKLVEQYKRQLGYGEFRLVVVTDGLAKEIPSAARYAQGFRIPIYAIGLGIEGDHPLRAHAVSYREANKFDDLERALEETLAELPSFDVAEFE